MNKNKTADTRATAGANLGRRRFLARSTAAAVGVGALGGTLLSPAAWAAKAVGDHASATLLRMARDIYPHDRLEDKYYAQVMTPLAEKAETDADLKALLKEGVAALDAQAQQHFGKPYLDIAAETDRVTLLKAQQDTPFFQKIRGDLMMGIYNNPELWPRFGYGGSSWEQGGYRYRGYEKNDWIEGV
ncbi:gluconate 2-dehydrogenase subunit 3 family protein [Marinobacterium rhizophilum]|uniref:Gluconate 2-dehydrogenase subunit 3 family protein n=1 Tax=Marinobacterium rhizophilum TaxID=420402 RepID=A0ABY5HKC1_9GAMM|nr:gluconate 2-dehydrogenase subunit 3 family protein [Marinobacterium rhizophilum]UTW12745.1 gluconate 2-dehydrogenase subunit 3 family protein [Marinobacterium rhizophilum]